MSKREIEEQYGVKCKLLQYESLRAAIPKKWLTLIKENSSLNLNYTVFKECKVLLGDRICKIEETSTKEVYWHLVNLKSLRATSEAKWNEKLSFIIDNDMWKLIYTNDRHVTNDTYIQNFQFKITHRILACKYNLHIWKIKDNNKCETCQEIDTIEHFLVQCHEVYFLWQQIFNWWASSMETRFQIDTYEIIFGVPNERDEPLVNQINFIILYGKFYIYQNKKKGKKLDLYEFLLECKNQIIYKEEAMTIKHEEKKFERIWGELKDSLC